MSQAAFEFEPEPEVMRVGSVFETEPKGMSSFIVRELAEVVDVEKTSEQPKLPLADVVDVHDIHEMSEEEYHELNWRDGRSPASDDTA